jgi:hypothetical protein
MHGRLEIMRNRFGLSNILCYFSEAQLVSEDLYKSHATGGSRNVSDHDTNGAG